MSKIIKVFDYLDYKKFVRDYIHNLPKKGHGQFLKIAKALNIHTTMVTHIFKGDLHLSSEQSLGLADFLGLNSIETDCFVNLVLLERASDQRTKKYYQHRVQEIQNKAQQIGHRLEQKNVLDEKDQAFYYSNWIYSAIRLLSSVPEYQTPNAMAEYLKLPLPKIIQSLDFLLSRGLCVEEKGKIVYGNVKTYLTHDSPLVGRHHANWRAKTLEKVDLLRSEDLMYTYPVVISEKDFLKIKEEVLRFLEEFKKIADPSPSEKLYCLNIDWIKI